MRLQESHELYCPDCGAVLGNQNEVELNYATDHNKVLRPGAKFTVRCSDCGKESTMRAEYTSKPDDLDENTIIATLDKMEESLDKILNEAKPSGERGGDSKPFTGKEITIEAQYSIPAKEGCKHFGIPAQDIDDVFDSMDKLEKAVSKELKKEVGTAHLGKVEFIEADSNNFTHAGLYFSVELRGTEEELKKVAGEDKELFWDWGDSKDTSSMVLNTDNPTLIELWPVLEEWRDAVGELEAVVSFEKVNQALARGWKPDSAKNYWKRAKNNKYSITDELFKDVEDFLESKK